MHLQLCVLVLSVCSVFSFPATEKNSSNLNIFMPDVVASHDDEYLCASFELTDDEPIHITGFHPSAVSSDVHHMLLYGCTEPGGTKKIWNCNEMDQSNGNSSQNYETRPTCASGSAIIYGWAMDADKTDLPSDVAFKVGGSTSIKYLVLQVHYASIEKFEAGATDRSGLTLTTSATPTTKRAGVLLLATGGQIQANSEEMFQAACRIEQDIVMHPFAFRVHTHGLGLVNVGYRVHGQADEQEWTEIGRKSPQLPQTFYPTENDVSIRQNDVVAAVCTMFNTRSHLVSVGRTRDEEMCNFYMMYWVDGDRLLDNSICASQGPPRYYFGMEKLLNVNRIPTDAFRAPSSNTSSSSTQSKANSHHMKMHGSEPAQERPLHE